MDMMKLDLPNKDIEQLIKYFRLKEEGKVDMIDYKSFNEIVESVFINKQLEKDPLGDINNVKFKPALDPDDILNDEEEHILDKCLKRLGYLIYKQHTVLKT